MVLGDNFPETERATGENMVRKSLKKYKILSMSEGVSQVWMPREVSHLNSYWSIMVSLS